MKSDQRMFTMICVYNMYFPVEVIYLILLNEEVDVRVTFSYVRTPYIRHIYIIQNKIQK